MPTRGTMIKVGMTVHNLVEALAISRSNILDVGNVLESSLNLERRSAGLCQIL